MRFKLRLLLFYINALVGECFGNSFSIKNAVLTNEEKGYTVKSNFSLKKNEWTYELFFVRASYIPKKGSALAKEVQVTADNAIIDNMNNVLYLNKNAAITYEGYNIQAKSANFILNDKSIRCMTRPILKKNSIVVKSNVGSADKDKVLLKGSVETHIDLNRSGGKLDSTSAKRAYVVCDSALYDKVSNSINCKGNLSVSLQDLVIIASSLKILFSDKNQIKKVIIPSSLIIYSKSGATLVQCKLLQYDAFSGRIFLKDCLGRHEGAFIQDKEVIINTAGQKL